MRWRRPNCSRCQTANHVRGAFPTEKPTERGHRITFYRSWDPRSITAAIYRRFNPRHSLHAQYPAMVGKGASALYASTQVTTTQRALAEAVTDSVGMTVWVAEEALLDAVTAVSGSGPAYFFSLIEAVSQTGVELGLEPETALALTLQTAIGAAELAQHSDMPVAKLRENVTSPGGTTEQALLALKDGHFDAVVSEAVRRCAERAKTLGEEFG